MCQCIYSEQVIGSAFYELIQIKNYELQIEKLYEIEGKLDKKLRSDNNAMVCMPIRDVYLTVENYNNFFEIKEDAIFLSDEFVEKIKIDINNGLSKLDKYFIDGIPKSINITIKKTMKSILTQV